MPLSEHYNAPLRPHVWCSRGGGSDGPAAGGAVNGSGARVVPVTGISGVSGFSIGSVGVGGGMNSHGRAWTPRALVAERDAFFDTRVTGHAEVWAALAAATALMRDGEMATAQGIVDAAGVTVPTGDLADGAYDEGGVFYRLPEHVVSDPLDLVADDDVDPDEDGEGDGTLCGLDEDLDADSKFVADDSEDELDGKVDGISVVVRLSDRGRDIAVSLGKHASVAALERRLRHEAKVSGRRGRG